MRLFATLFALVWLTVVGRAATNTAADCSYSAVTNAQW